MNTDRHADYELRRLTADLLRHLADEVSSGRVKRWQIENVLPSLRMVSHILTTAPGTPVSIETGRSEP